VRGRIGCTRTAIGDFQHHDRPSHGKVRAMRMLFVFLLGLSACHHEPPQLHPKPGYLPPLPPASGTPVGYLLDAASDLKLNNDQVTKLKEIDTSLAAEDDEIDTQLRQIEKPDTEGEQPQKQPGGPPPKRHNHAPGAMVKTTADAGKLHERKKANDREALKRAFLLLDADQQTTARKILGDRGVEAPGSAAKKASNEPNPDGVPLEP
jgi:hypothetical protein